AMLYEALTGRRPHSGSPLDVLRRKQSEDPAPPALLAPGGPAPLEDLAMRLLARRPEARASGDAVRAALGLLAVAAPAAAAEVSFVGRSQELGRLFEALDESRRATTVAFVTGDSGIGKSALCEAFTGGARRDRGAVVLPGRCHEREEIPFRAVDAAIDALGQHLDGLDPEAARALAPLHAALLVRTFPVLGRVRALAEGPVVPLPHERGEQAGLAFAALRDLLGALAESPLVLVVDDFQWTD